MSLILSTAAVESEIRIGYFLEEAIWGRGLTSELIAGLVASLQGSDPVLLIGGVSRPNPASAKVLTKNGFVVSGREDPVDPDTTLFELSLD